MVAGEQYSKVKIYERCWSTQVEFEVGSAHCLIAFTCRKYILFFKDQLQPHQKTEKRKEQSPRKLNIEAMNKVSVTAEPALI